MSDMLSISPRRNVSGHVTVPGSKSYAQRVIAIAALIEEDVQVEGLTRCDDVNSALKVIRTIGVDISETSRGFSFKGSMDRSKDYRINCGEAGLSTRLFSTFSLLTDRSFCIDGKGSILQRPMNMVIDALSQAGKSIQSNDGKLPLEIHGKTQQLGFEIDGSTSSQLLTGLLIVSPFLGKDITIKVKDLKSVPYIDMTVKVMQSFGLDVQHENYDVFDIKPFQKSNGSNHYVVEGDWSAASFLIVAGLIGGEVKISGLNQHSLQADKKILEVVTITGGKYEWENEDLNIQSASLSPFSFDATHCPDLFPPLAVLAAMIDGTSEIKGVHRLKHKESDRSTALVNELSELGIVINEIRDDLRIEGLSASENIEGGNVFSHNDHRMAMALALMSLRSSGDIIISGASSINKSYPGFYNDFFSLTNL